MRVAVETIKKSAASSGLRHTPQRCAAMALLMKHARHPTASEILRAVNRTDQRCVGATSDSGHRRADESEVRRIS